MKTILLYTLLFVTLGNADNIDFAPKQKLRELKKVSGCDRPVYDELKEIRDTYPDTSSGKFFELRNALPIKYSYIGRVYTCRAGGCGAPNAAMSYEGSEFFDYFILFDSSASIVSVQIFNYEATHGHEISVRSWLKQFVGHNAGSELIVGKNVDAISGATISVHGITDDIRNKTLVLKKHIGKHSTQSLPGHPLSTQGINNKGPGRQISAR